MSESTYEKTIDERQADDKKKFIAVLSELPIIQAACNRVGISRDTYYRWRREDEEFRHNSKEALGQGIEFINDMGEAQVIQLIKEGKLPAMALWLKHNNPRYGGKVTYRPDTTPPKLPPEKEEIFKRNMVMLSKSVITKKRSRYEI